MSHRYLFVGGGSGGHTVPLLAVRQAVLKIEPDAEIRIITSDRDIDREFMEREGLSFDAVPYPRMGPAFPGSFLRNYRTASRVIRAWKPDVVFSKGGALSVPACIAARLRGIPVVLHESDSVMGSANRFVARIAMKVCVGFAPQDMGHETRDEHSYLKTHISKLIITGNPVRPRMTEGSREEALLLTGFSGAKPILLVTGGSQGAQAINEAVWNDLDALLDICDVAHLTGTGKLRSISRPGYWSSEMSSDMLHHLYAAADMAVSRAGAGSIGELAANGIPTILVPIRGLAQDHQYKNAIVARDNGGCVLLLQEELPEKLVPEISRILKDEGLRSQMRKKFSAMHHPEAAVRIAKIIAECVA